MRIDLVAPRFHPTWGGIEEAVGQIAKRLRAGGHDVTIHATRLEGLAATDEWNGIPVRRYEPTMARGYYVSRFEPDLKGDVVHLHAYAHHTNDWVIDHHGTKRIFLSTHHGAQFPKAGLGGRIYHSIYNRTVGIPNLRKIEGVLVPTSFDLEDFERRGVPKERIHVVPSGVDDAAFEPAVPYEAEGVDSRLGYFLFLGRLHEEKGIRELLAAYQVAAVPTHLVFAGRDEGMASLIREVAKRDPRIHLVTDFTGDDKWRMLAGCRSLVLPSRHEGQGIVLAEAWAQGRAVIAVRAGAVPRVVDHETDGLLVPLGDKGALAAAMRRLVASPALARRLGEAGRKKAEAHYRWDAIVKRLEGLYVGEGTRAAQTGTLAETPTA